MERVALKACDQILGNSEDGGVDGIGVFDRDAGVHGWKSDGKEKDVRCGFDPKPRKLCGSCGGKFLEVAEGGLAIKDSSFELFGLHRFEQFFETRPWRES